MPSIWTVTRKSLIPLLVLAAAGVGFEVASSGAATSSPSARAAVTISHLRARPHVISSKPGLQTAYYETAQPISVAAGEATAAG